MGKHSCQIYLLPVQNHLYQEALVIKRYGKSLYSKPCIFSPRATMKNFNPHTLQLGTSDLQIKGSFLSHILIETIFVRWPSHQLHQVSRIEPKPP